MRSPNLSEDIDGKCEGGTQATLGRTHVRSCLPSIVPHGGIPLTAERDQRPWGEYTVLDEGFDYKVKRITVAAGKRLSYQRHARREEHWFFVRGFGRVTLEGREFDVSPGCAVDIPTGAAHRIANTGTSDLLVFVEVQRGEYFGEDDIIRLADDHGRVAETP